MNTVEHILIEAFHFFLFFTFTLLGQVKSEEIFQYIFEGFSICLNLLATWNSTVSIWLRFYRFSRGLRSALFEDFPHSKFSGFQLFPECFAKVLIKVLIKNGFEGDGAGAGEMIFLSLRQMNFLISHSFCSTATCHLGIVDYRQSMWSNIRANIAWAFCYQTRSLVGIPRKINYKSIWI